MKGFLRPHTYKVCLTEAVLSLLETDLLQRHIEASILLDINTSIYFLFDCDHPAVRQRAVSQIRGRIFPVGSCNTASLSPLYHAKVKLTLSILFSLHLHAAFMCSSDTCNRTNGNKTRQDNLCKKNSRQKKLILN